MNNQLPAADIVDDWRGEHFLKVEPDNTQSNRAGFHGANRHLDNRNCAHPGCNAHISRQVNSGVCKAHLHQASCRCKTCEAAR